MLRIGLTGGIGSGKSTATNYFAKLKVPIIDADSIVHELLQPNTDTYKKIINQFGQGILNPNNQIDRKKLRDLIFSHNHERTWLERLLHPRVRIEINQRLTNLQTPYCILSVPLLLETKSPIKVDRILVIDCPKTIQIKRIRKRESITYKQINAIIDSQINRASRLKKANDIICNNGTLANLKKSIVKLHNYYLSLA